MLRYGCWVRDWEGPISQIVFVTKFNWTTLWIQSLPRFVCVYSVFVAVRMLLWRAELGRYAGQRESNAARLACEEEVWLRNIVD
jgi:hypothetical protein